MSSKTLSQNLPRFDCLNEKPPPDKRAVVLYVLQRVLGLSPIFSQTRQLCVYAKRHPYPAGPDPAELE